MKKGNLAKTLLASSGIIGVAAINMFAVAQAQQSASPAPQTQKVEEDVQTVIVVGTRASQQSSIDKKKKAKTATDSIVADDVGSFPDRNLAEALSRIPGMGLARGETGEGAGVNLRGNGADLTRVEMDGMSVSTASNDLAINGSSGSGRSTDLRELPADLIKSVDVVKGQTPDMTEGGLGGTVQIQTRTGLDFKKPYVQLRVGLDRNSLSQRWSPDINLIASRKFLDGRLGVLFNVTKTRRLNDSHQLNGAGSSNAQGYSRLIDWDNSPEKTFSFNPSTVSGDAADTPRLSFANVDTTKPNFTTYTPRQIVERAASAKTKADCATLFPLYTAAELNTVSAGSSNNNRRDVQQQRILEQVTCLNQWNDYSPGLYRDINLTQYEDRLAWDIRFDYKVNDNLNVYVKYQVADRTQDDIRRNRTRGQVNITNSDALIVANSLTTNTTFPLTSQNTLSLVPGVSGYYFYNTTTPTGARLLDNTAGSTTTNNAFPIMGYASNVVPGSVVVDANHFVTALEMTNGQISYDNIRNEQNWKSNYLLLGANYKKGPLKIDFQANRGESSYTKYDRRFRLAIPYGNGKMVMQDSGLWDIQFPAGFNPNDLSNIYPLNAAIGATPAEQAAAARYTNSIGVDLSPGLNEVSEDMAKLDVTYRLDDIPFFTSFKTGVSYRKTDTERWGGGGYEVKTGTFVPSTTLRGSIRACENQATTTAANACAYGFVPGTGTASLYGVETVTRAQLLNLFSNAIEYNDGPFMPGYEGADGMRLWNTVDVDKAIAQMAAGGNYNLDCVKVCRGSDGQMYAQPVNNVVEQVTAAYYMVEFEQKLPLSLSFNGNFGVRMVQSTVNGTGQTVLRSIRKLPTWNSGAGNANVVTSDVSKPISINREYTDWMPSYNANLWAFDDKVVLRYNWSKAIARPPAGRLWPAGMCTIDERLEDRIDEGEEDLDLACTTFGNPDLKPYRATKNNTSLEWYINKDTFVSLAYYRQKIKVGAPETVRVTNNPIFAGSDEIDPVTGRPLSEFTFAYTTYRNGPGSTQSGWELATKTALTFLPWRFRYTGVDFNISTNKEKGAAGYIDTLTGESVGVPGRANYFANLKLWYDDGKTNAALTYQARDRALQCVSGCGNSISGIGAFPNQNPENRVELPYNPGEPYYTAAYQYLDAKITHKVRPNIEVYWEARNLLYEANVREGTRVPSNGGNDWSASYGGRRFNFGVIYKLQ
ncbi:TonB-dependent receptor [Asticcacaulis sp. BYS171W]|uniref:TonB-dependent receptor n=1 Tax=Asticcacaulis aquaticus TaxID=2984212 RepID=A0ABT5HYX8_9CAUL|nr:TonB-dependent receptor [Asticcacaulis aquaticus]MDC7685194.1 TonB-dependent receptor [Asticcacaulis aquaticus]